MKFVFPLGLLLTVLGFSGGSWRLFSDESSVLISAGRFIYFPGLLLVALSIFSTWRGTRSHSPLFLDRLRRLSDELTEAATSRPIWAIGLVALLVTDWPARPFGFYPSAWIRAEFLIGVTLTYFLVKKPIHTWAPFAAIGVGLLFIWSFFTTANGRLLFSDDHAMFLFRLHLLKENFPFIPFWTPLWNAGIDARDFFATGALAPFFLSAPLVYFLDVTRAYNWIVAYLLWIVTPLCSYLAARLFSSSRGTAALAALLSITSSMLWYRWTLKYGTMGFCVSTATAPLVLALGWRFITKESLSVKECIAGVCLLTLMLLWTPSGLAVIPPLAIIGAPYLLKVARSPRKVIVIVALLAINLPIFFTLWRVSAVGKFLNTPDLIQQSVTIEQKGGRSDIARQAADATTKGEIAHSQSGFFRHRGGQFSLEKSLKTWQEFALSLNPLLLLCAIPALFALPKSQRTLGVVATTWLVVGGTFAVTIFPQLELDRMLVMLAVLLCYPVASFVCSHFTLQSHSFMERSIQLVYGGFLFMSIVAVGSIISNRTKEQYAFASQTVSKVVEVANTYADGGRVLFTGCIIHELSGGHLAPLSLWTQAPLLASSYAHNIWHYEQPIPASYMRRDEEGIEDFFNTMNGTVLFAHEPYWRKYMSARPTQYREVWRGDGFIAYKRLQYNSTYDLDGNITITSTSSNSITFTTSSPAVTLKYKFYPFLTSSGCTLTPYTAAPEIRLIRAENCPIGSPITIQSAPPLARIFGGLMR